MLFSLTLRVIMSILAAFLLSICTASSVWTQSLDDLPALSKKIGELYRNGQYAEGSEIAKRALVIAEKSFGIQHPRVAAIRPVAVLRG